MLLSHVWRRSTPVLTNLVRRHGATAPISNTIHRFASYTAMGHVSRLAFMKTSLPFTLGFAASLGSGLALRASCDGSSNRTPKAEEDLTFLIDDTEDKGKNLKVEDKEKWAILLSLMAKDKWYYVVAVVCSVCSSLATSAQSKVIGVLFDLMGSQDPFSLAQPLRHLLVLFIAQAALSFVSSFVLAAASTEFGKRLRKMFYEAVLNRDIEKFDTTRTGELTHQLSQDIGALQSAVRTSFSRGIEGITSLVSGSVYLYVASPKLAACMFAILPVMSFAAHMLGVLLRGVSAEIRKVENHATGVANETIGAIKTVRSFGATERELDRYSDELEEVARLKRVMALAAGGFYSLLGLGINLIVLVISGYGGQLVSTGEITRGGIAAVVTQVQILERSMARVSVVGAQIAKAFRSAEHIFDMLLEAPLVNSASRGLGLCVDPSSVKGDVRFVDVDFSYPSRPNVRVLSKFSLHLEAGNTVALVGNSGGGKSTLAALLERFYDVDGGRILVDGLDIRDLDPDCLHKIVGIVSQEPVLFGTSIIDNIRYGRPEAAREEVIRAAKLANAHDFIARFPCGYDTQLGERGVSLSGGQKQRIAIARAILSDPRVLILDEATSALDAESEYLVQQALSTLMKNRTTLIIAHRLTTVKRADLICVLEEGAIVEKGQHASLMKQTEGQYRALFRRQNTRAESRNG